jgi:hypothetical protein
MKILVILGDGGHSAEMLRLLGLLGPNNGTHFKTIDRFAPSTPQSNFEHGRQYRCAHFSVWPTDGGENHSHRNRLSRVHYVFHRQTDVSHCSPILRSMGIATKGLPQSHLCREVIVIFVTIGTTDFDALTQTMDNLSLDLPEKVVVQIGKGKYIPEHCEYFRFAPSLDPYYERASLVVSHGGLGIITEVLERGLPLVAVEDPNQPDRHQRDLLSV